MKNSLKQFGAVSQGREFKWFVKCLIPLTLLCCEQSNCNAQNRTLSFPDNQTIGTLSTYPPPQESDNIPEYTKFSHSANSIGAACGNREVPEDAFIGLAIDDLDSDPNLLALIPIDGIQRLSLNRVTLSTETLQQIERIKSLRQLILNECRFVGDIDISSLKGLPRLQELWCSHKKEKDRDDAPIAKWASICPQLQYYSCSSRRSLTIDEIRAFHGHESPLFLTVTLGDDSSDAIEALAGIPKLVALNLHVSADGRQDFYRSLPKLKQIALINWSGGELNETLLESFKAMDQIRTLRFQSGAKPPNLSSLQISLSTRNPDDWSFIANAPALQRIDIMDGYCDDRIVGWIDQCKSLRSFLGGQDTIMTDAGVEQLSKCEHLTSLSIGGFIDGNAVRGLAHLPHLSSLSISTDLISEGERTELSKSFANLTRFGIKDLYPTAGGIVVGADSIYRVGEAEGRETFDALEGMPLTELLGDALTTELKKELHQKVVLVEFWGTWCGPCKMFMPELERLQMKYGEQGFQVLGIHSESGHEKANDFLVQHPKSWPNLIDDVGELEENFHVPHFPSLYLVGPDGNIRVALAHQLGLDRAIEMLLTD